MEAYKYVNGELVEKFQVEDKNQLALKVARDSRKYDFCVPHIDDKNGILVMLLCVDEKRVDFLIYYAGGDGK